MTDPVSEGTTPGSRTSVSGTSISTGHGSEFSSPVDPAARLRERNRASLVVLAVTQVLSGVGTSTGIAMSAIIVTKVTGIASMGGLGQTATVSGTAIIAIVLARFAVSGGRRFSLSFGYLVAAVGAAVVLFGTSTHIILFVFLGLVAFGAGNAAGLQARFAATEYANEGFEGRSMSIVLWCTTLGTVTGPLLASEGNRFGVSIGLAEYSGPFMLSLIMFIFAAVVMRIGLGRRPGELFVKSFTPPIRSSVAFRNAWKLPASRIAILSIICSHTVMVGVMVMTSVHLTDAGDPLILVGIVISIHVFGMYGASPLFGWLVDKIGSYRVIAVGVVTLAVAVILGLFGGTNHAAIMVALGLLGFGWSAGLIGGSTLLTKTVDQPLRVPLQGATDSAMSIAAAASAALSGVLYGAGGFGWVNIVALVVLAPLVLVGVLALRKAVLFR